MPEPWETWLPPQKENKIPPPEERLCIFHTRPISEKDWIKGHRKTECSKCKNIRASRKHNNRSNQTVRPGSKDRKTGDR